MTRSHAVAAALLAAIVATSGVARAEPPASPSAPEAATTAPADTDANASTESDGASVPGIVLMIVGGVAVAAGATLAIADALREPPTTYERGLDPGVGGARGRAGQLPVVESSAMGPAGAVLLGAGALVHVIGVALVFGGDSGGEASPKPARASVEPVIGPGYGGLQGSF